MRNSKIRRQHKEKSSTVKKIFLFLFIIVFIAGAGAAAGFFLSVSSGLPDISANIAPDASSRIYDAKGRLITTVHAEENRLPVSIDEVPANLQNAFIAVEDNRFYEHHGVDPLGIIRAVFRNIISGNATAQGGEHHYAAAGAKRFPFAGTDAETQAAGGFSCLKDRAAVYQKRNSGNVYEPDLFRTGLLWYPDGV